MCGNQVTATLIVAGTLAMWTNAAGASRTSGIYLTAADYQKARLTSEGDCKSNAHEIELHDVLNRPYIEVTHGSERRRYAKNELFGFRSCDGLDHRFDGDREYQILEAKDLYVYAIPRSRRGTDYFFSVGPSGPVLALTLDNLKDALPDNHRFHDSLDQTFRSGLGLTQYDKFHKMFKVNRLLMASYEH